MIPGWLMAVIRWLVSALVGVVAAWLVDKKIYNISADEVAKLTEQISYGVIAVAGIVGITLSKWWKSKVSRH